MYQQLRNEVLMALSDQRIVTLEDVIRVLDMVSEGYEVRKKNLEIVVWNGELPSAAKVYLICKKMAGLSEGTLENYRLILKNFFSVVQKPIHSITTNDIRMWLYTYQEDRNVGNRTMDKYRECIARFFSWALEEGYVTSNPAKNIESIRFETKQRQALTQIQLEYLRKACLSARDSAMLEVLYSTGCRVSELADMKKEDVDWRELSVHIVGKGRKHRYSFLNAKAEVSLKLYLDSRNDDSEYLFVSKKYPHNRLHRDGVEKIMRDISNRADLGRTVTPHIIRHTTATIALHNGMPIEDISKLLGHESVDTTMIYAKTSIESVHAGHRKYII